MEQWHWVVGGIRTVLQAGYCLNLHKCLKKWYFKVMINRTTLYYYWYSLGITINQSEHVGDVAVPVSVQCSVLCPSDWIGADLPPPSSARCVLDDLNAASSSLEWAICRLVKHGNDLGTSLPGPRGQTTWGVWSTQCLIAVAVYCPVRLRIS